MEYNPIPNDDSDNKKRRYTLVQKGQKTLYVIGLNPSKANSKESDATMRKILRLAEFNGFDGFVMMNLYARRKTYPKKLSLRINYKLHRTNIKKILQQLQGEQEPTILLCFGNNILIRPYLQKCWDEIRESVEKQVHPNWVCVGKTKYGYPKHPARLSSKLTFIPY